ncbi:MAG: oligosaccharide flippase family protein, partial [Prevotellaceae bacterium]|nr:oligosaccharide flippase family protein [Candidatus Faecinaster equi]
MTDIINIKKNRILYSVDCILQLFVNTMFSALKLVSPQKYEAKVEALSTNRSIRNIIGLTMFNALGGVLLMFTNIKLANALGATVFGIYSYCLAIGEAGSNFVRYGRHKTMLRDIVREPENRNSLINSTFLLSCINLVVFLIMVCIFHKQLDLVLCASTFFLIIAPCLISLDFQPVYESLKMMSWHSIYNLLQKVAFLIPIWLILAYKSSISLISLSIILFFSWLVSVITQVWEIKTNLKVKFRLKGQTDALLKLYKCNFLITLCCFTGVAFGPLIRLILNNYLDSSMVGIYAAGCQILVLSQFFIQQVARIGNPKMAEVCIPNYSKSAKISFIKKYVFVMEIIVMPFALALIFLSGVIVDFAYTTEYEALKTILPIYGIYLPICAAGIVFNQHMISIKNDKIYFSFYVGSAILSVVIALIAISKWGLIGGVLAHCIADGMASLCYT